ncbi:MAG TPA: 2-oxoglutarate dehydrogenase complex dihydrolipoyllysine-residue succinyltransferase [Chitinophagales bacterium]|nr:2-oxoglutarate dehydrogenase complex dihydrolipoyllysine-residue succinyltransferase [Chitinophagales bacterium]
MKVEIKVPSIGESVNEVTLSSWLVEDGETVDMDQSLCEFESDKATLELPAEVGGVFTRVAKEGDDLKIGDLVGYIDTEGAGKKSDDKKEDKPSSEESDDKKEETESSDKSSEKKEEVESEEKTTYATAHPSPAAKKILEEKNIQPEDVKGTGKDGRITKEDAEKASAPKKETEPASPKEEKVEKVDKKEDEKEPEEKTKAVAGSRNERVEKMSRLRRTISRRLVEVKNETAMLTTFNEVDMTKIMGMRKQYKEEFTNEHGINLGFMSFFVKACTLALQKFPSINAYLEDDSIVYHDFQDVSIAVSTPKGLVVPVIRNTETLGFADIEKEIKRLATLGRDGQLSIDDMTGGTFTITNGGVFGSLLSTPIINQPQSAILGMHKIQDRAMVIDGQIEARPMMYLALSYDHRIVDGKESVSFLVAVKEYLENPEKMLFGI